MEKENDIKDKESSISEQNLNKKELLNEELKEPTIDEELKEPTIDEKLKETHDKDGGLKKK